MIYIVNIIKRKLESSNKYNNSKNSYNLNNNFFQIFKSSDRKLY